MIGEGTFPFRQDDDEYEDAPAVGDGVIFLDHDMRVRFASPNAVERDAPDGDPLLRVRAST